MISGVDLFAFGTDFNAQRLGLCAAVARERIERPIVEFAISGIPPVEPALAVCEAQSFGAGDATAAIMTTVAPYMAFGFGEDARHRLPAVPMLPLADQIAGVDAVITGVEFGARDLRGSCGPQREQLTNRQRRRLERPAEWGGYR